MAPIFELILPHGGANWVNVTVSCDIRFRLSFQQFVCTACFTFAVFPNFPIENGK